MSKKSKQGSQYVKVALMCIAALVIFYFGTQYLKGIDIFGTRTYYYCVFEDCGGLVESTPVQLNGYKIGKVEKVSLLSSQPIRICAKLLIYPFSTELSSKRKGLHKKATASKQSLKGLLREKHRPHASAFSFGFRPR